MTCTDIFGVAGSAWLDALRLPQPYAGKVTSLRQLAGELTTEITMLMPVEARGLTAPGTAASAGGMNSFSWPAARREVAELSALPPPGGAGALLIDPA